MQTVCVMFFSEGSLGEEVAMSSEVGSRHILAEESGDVLIVRFQSTCLLEDLQVDEIGQELFDLVDERGKRKVIISFHVVDFMSARMLGKLITLNKKIKALQGKLVLCIIRPAVYEIFSITKLNQFFVIKDGLASALSEF